MPEVVLGQSGPPVGTAGGREACWAGRWDEDGVDTGSSACQSLPLLCPLTQVDRYLLKKRARIILLAEGRLVNLGCLWATLAL